MEAITKIQPALQVHFKKRIFIIKLKCTIQSLIIDLLKATTTLFCSPPITNNNSCNYTFVK